MSLDIRDWTGFQGWNRKGKLSREFLWRGEVNQPFFFSQFFESAQVSITIFSWLIHSLTLPSSHHFSSSTFSDSAYQKIVASLIPLTNFAGHPSHRRILTTEIRPKVTQALKEEFIQRSTLEELSKLGVSNRRVSRRRPSPLLPFHWKALSNSDRSYLMESSILNST